MKALLLALALISTSAACLSADERCIPPAGTQAFEFIDGEHRLRGYIDVPVGRGPHAAVLIIHGSGETDVFHRATEYNGTYESLRRTFRAAGLATVVWDKAGNGCSSGGYANGNPIRERATETVAALRALKQRSDIDAARMGLWGISQGGWIAPMAAVQVEDVSFLILVSSPAGDAMSQLEYQALSALRTSGVAGAELDAAASRLRRAFAIMRAGGPVEAYIAEVAPLQKYAVLAELGFRNEGSLEGYRRWQDSIDFQYRPDSALRELRQPVLAIFGDHDALIDWRESMRLYRAIFRESRNRDVTIKVFRNANHNLMRVGADSPFTEGYLRTMEVWLAKRTGVRNAH